MTTTTVGAFNDRIGAEKAIADLRDHGIADSEISCLYSEKDGKIKDTHAGEAMGDGAIKGATVGAAVGAIAGLVVANGILPGIGTLFVAGPIATAIGLTGAAATTVAGAVTGLAAGGLLGALTNMGLSKEDAEYYQNMLHSGSYLVITRSEKNVAKEVLESNHSRDVREYKNA